MKRTTTSLAIAATLSLASMQSSAALITQWDYTATLNWQNTAFTSGNGSTFASPDVLSWGNSGQLVTPNGIPNIGEERSGLYISPLGSTVNVDDPTLSGIIGTNAGPTDTFEVTHVNNPIDVNFSMLETTGLYTTLSINPTGGGNPNVSLGFTFAVTFEETLNQAPCQFTQGPDCADIFSIGITALTPQSFSYDGIDYNVLIGSVDFVDVGGGELGLVTEEGALTTAGFNFQITAQAVPAPGILALFGTGLLGFGFMATRRRRT